MEKKRKSMLGRVVSNKMDKTVVVAVEVLKHHPLYKKAIKRKSMFKAHDENKQCGLGDTVRIVETRPLSKEKRWRVAEIITKGEVVEAIREVEVAEAPPAVEVTEEQPKADN